MLFPVRASLDKGRGCGAGSAGRRVMNEVGGGFAGATAARALATRLPADMDLVLLSKQSYTTFNPLLPEAVGASIFPEQVVAPLREMLMLDGRSRFIMGRVTSVNTQARRLRCSTLAGEHEVACDHLVLAFGNRARLLPELPEALGAAALKSLR